MKRRVLAIWLVMVVLSGALVQGLAADEPESSLVFDISPPDKDGRFDVTMTVYNIDLRGIQLALRYNTDVVNPIDSNGNAAQMLEDFVVFEQDWMLNFGSADVDAGYIELGLLTSIVLAPGEPLNQRGEMTVGDEGLLLYTLHLRRVGDGDAELQIASKEEGKPYWADCPTGIVVANGVNEKLPISVTFCEKEKPTQPVRTETFVPASTPTANAPAEPQRTAEDLLKDVIVLRIGSHTAVVEGGVTALYPGEKDVKPYLKNDRTFVPIRFVSERLGAEVDWDNDTQTAIVKKDGHTILMPIGSATYTVDGEQRQLDAPAELVHDRTMVPIRFISEALGYQVGWEGTNELVVISPPELDWNENGTLETEALNKALNLMLMFGNFV